MKLLVCIKQIPDMESHFKPNSNGSWYDESNLAYRINEYDEYAIEQAVQLKEQLNNEPDVTVVCVGPDRATEALRKALSMGCDRAVHIQDSDSFLKEPWQIANIISGFAHDKQFDLIFTGMQSQDRGSAQVGITVAELLGYSSVSTLIGFEYENGVVTAKRELEGGVKGIVKSKLPLVVTCQMGLNIPRYPTLPNIMKAKKKELLGLPVENVQGVTLTATDRVYPPVKKGKGIVLEGDVGNMADQLINILKEKTSVVR